MIRYALKCREGHAFESWFKSASAFDTLVEAGHVTCAVCGGADVTKAMMTPKVVMMSSKSAEVPATPLDTPDPQEAQGMAIAKMRKQVEDNATYVGGRFAEKAREMHDGTSAETSIYGEASAEEARSLIEDGVPVIPLPFKPKQKLQ